SQCLDTLTIARRNCARLESCEQVLLAQFVQGAATETHTEIRAERRIAFRLAFAHESGREIGWIGERKNEEQRDQHRLVHQINDQTVAAQESKTDMAAGTAFIPRIISSQQALDGA